jgi:aspartate/methionine/tyrosine aminotransferase
MVPGDAFGMPDYLRLSYAVHQDELRQALERIEEALGRLQR